jgi:Domain of unknown function (DUF222)
VEDTRSHAQRYHDALQEAMRRLLAAGLLPERAGQPVRALVHMSLADLMRLDGSSALMEEWSAQVRAQWAAARATASVSGSDGGAWLDGEAAVAFPAAIRRAVILRDQHCRFPGGCDQPAAGCEVHHLRHQAHGGPTSVTDCALFCFFHHHVVIHQWGWTVILNPDGTTTAWNKDKTKVLHSHSPPAGPG